MGDEHDLGRFVPSYEGAEPAGGGISLALFVLAHPRRELLVFNDLVYGLEVRMTGKIDRQVEEPEREAILVPAGVSAQLSASR